MPHPCPPQIKFLLYVTTMDQRIFTSDLDSETFDEEDKAVQTKFAAYCQKVFNFAIACGRAVIIQIGGMSCIDVYARAHDRVGHALQLERLRSRSGIGSENPCGWWR